MIQDATQPPFDAQKALEYWLNVRQLCDGDLTYLERKQAEQRLIDEIKAPTR